MSQLDASFETLLLHLKEHRGFDFTGYKRSSLTRRVNRRMAQVGVSDYAEYLDYLEVHTEEFTALFNTILINVTGFFRDAEAWEYLRAEIIPAMLAAKAPDEVLRVWSAGCASGEEAYTLAMILAEALGMDEFRQRVKIYATDVDEDGLTHARHATYDEQQVRAVPAALLERYFDQVGSRFSFHKDLRRSVIFGRNDLVQDAPISKIDLLVCRNALMYFNAEIQSRILSRLHFALAPTGVLFLGKAEMLLSHAEMFQPIDLKRRVFRKVPRPLPLNGAFLAEAPLPHARPPMGGLELLHHAALLASPLAQVVVTADGLIALCNRQAEALFGVSSRDVGRPFSDVVLSYRPVELRRYIEQAHAERRMVRVADIEYVRGSETLCLDIEISPLADSDAGLLGVILSFHDVTEPRRLREELQQTNRQLETAYEELQSTNEELETMNEELQSTVEELETTNEELQSTNEELETMNEELQSTNDELQAINDELRDRTSDLNQAKQFLETILTGLRAGVAVLDTDMRVLVWNRRAEDLWGLRQDEIVGQHFLNLDIGLPTQQLRPLIRRTLAGVTGPHEMVLSAINRRGRLILVRVAGSPLNGADGSAHGAILLMEQDSSAPPDGTGPELTEQQDGQPSPSALDSGLEAGLEAGLNAGGDTTTTD
ncbi:MAG: PAS domain S-box protein [Pseudonocardiales bacterium]|nr:PAS domain S-box protein [Pseudonocardiales bacterium]